MKTIVVGYEGVGGVEGVLDVSNAAGVGVGCSASSGRAKGVVGLVGRDRVPKLGNIPRTPLHTRSASIAGVNGVRLLVRD